MAKLNFLRTSIQVGSDPHDELVVETDLMEGDEYKLSIAPYGQVERQVMRAQAVTSGAAVKLHFELVDELAQQMEEDDSYMNGAGWIDILDIVR